MNRRRTSIDDFFDTSRNEKRYNEIATINMHRKVCEWYVNACDEYFSKIPKSELAKFNPRDDIYFHFDYTKNKLFIGKKVNEYNFVGDRSDYYFVKLYTMNFSGAPSVVSGNIKACLVRFSKTCGKSIQFDLSNKNDWTYLRHKYDSETGWTYGEFCITGYRRPFNEEWTKIQMDSFQPGDFSAVLYV